MPDVAYYAQNYARPIGTALAYGGSNSDSSNELTLYVNVLLTISSPSASATSHRYLQCWLLKVTEFTILDSISTIFLNAWKCEKMGISNFLVKYTLLQLNFDSLMI